MMWKLLLALQTVDGALRTALQILLYCENVVDNDTSPSEVPRRLSVSMWQMT